VVVSVVHIVKGAAASPVLDTHQVRRISAYLVEGDLDTSPVALGANSGKAFVGSYALGMGFTFDDSAAAKGEAEGLETMCSLIAKDPRNSERIFPYIGGEEVNKSPTQAHHRYVIDFFDFPLRREPGLKAWSDMDEAERAKCRTAGIVPGDHPEAVAEGWPDLVEIVRRRVKPERDKQTRPALKVRWWQYAEKRPGLYAAIARLPRVLVTTRVSQFLTIAQIDAHQIYSEQLIPLAFSSFAPFVAVQCRIHETWARFFASTLEDRLRYTPSDCFRTFPFPESFESDASLEEVGASYNAFRAQLMIGRNEGLTKTYNRFHACNETAADISRLRAIHAEMDAVMLRAYGWDDLLDRAAPEFIEQDADEGKRQRHASTGDLTSSLPRLTQLVGVTRARGQWRIRPRRISISRLSDRRRGGPTAW
jgi:hypothetical protein